MKIKIITHYFEDDEECSGDYVWVEVFDVMNKRIMTTYGDYYPDKGEEKAEGFVDGVRYMAGEHVSVEYESVADATEY